MSKSLIKILAKILAYISGWLLIGTMLAYVLSMLWPSSIEDLSFFGFIFVIFLIPAKIASELFIGAFFPNGNFGVIIWSLLLFIIFSGSIYLLRKKL